MSEPTTGKEWHECNLPRHGFYWTGEDILRCWQAATAAERHKSNKQREALEIIAKHEMGDTDGPSGCTSVDCWACEEMIEIARAAIETGYEFEEWWKSDKVQGILRAAIRVNATTAERERVVQIIRRYLRKPYWNDVTLEHLLSEVKDEDEEERWAG